MAAERETQAYLVLANDPNGGIPDPSRAISNATRGLIFNRHDAMETHRQVVKHYGNDCGVYPVTLKVGPRIDLEDELDLDSLNEWQRLVLEEYPARGSILSRMQTVEDMARVVRAGLATEDQSLVDLVVELSQAQDAVEAAEIVERHADLAHRASQPFARPDYKHFETVKRVLESLVETIRPQDGPSI